MNRKASAVATVLLALAYVGCGGGTNYAKPTVNFDGGVDGAGADAATTDASRPPPMSGVGSTLLVPGLAVLVGTGPDSCTNQASASGDRWCGVVVPSVLVGQAPYDLLVVNVTKAAAGVAINCNNSPSDTCIRLTSNPLIDQNLGVSVHSFTGDTLIYFENPTTDATGATVSSPAFAWRPGWAGGQAITAAGSLFCLGHPTTDSVYCFANRVDDAAGNITADLLAGPMPAAGSLLPKVDTVLAVLATDDPGDMIAWSARPTLTGVETLNVQKLGDATTKQMVAADVSQWSISRDSARYYWLKTYNYDATAPSGTLQQAAFPDGSGAATVAATVADYVGAGNSGLILRTAATPSVLKAIPNRDALTGIQTLDTGVGGVVAVAPQGTRVAYFKTIDSSTFSNVSLVDLFVAGVDKTTPCAVIQMPTALTEGFFSGSGSALVWANVNVSAQTVSGAYADLTGCMSHTFAPNLLSATAVGEQGYVYGDQTVDGTDMTLEYAVASGGVLSAGTVVQTRADTTFSVLAPALPAVVYTVNANSGASGDGLYINATLPFTTTAPPADAGSGG